MKSEELLTAPSAVSLTAQPGLLNIVASDFDARPMSFCPHNNRRTGYEPELARIVCRRLGLQPVWHNVPMADFYTRIASESQHESRHETKRTMPCDVVWFNQAVTPERQQFVNFTRPYGLFDEAVLVKAASPIYAIADLAGARVGGLADSTNIALVKGFPKAEAVPYPGSDKVLPEMLEALRAGSIDALIDDELVLLVAAAEDPSLRLAFTLPTQAPFAVGVSKQRPALHKAIDTVLAELLTDNTMAALWTEWIPWMPFPF